VKWPSQKKQFKRAEDHFRKALKISLFESPNYDLLFELGQSLCRQKKQREGNAVLEDYICASGVELGVMSCKKASKTCADLVCGREYGSALSGEGKEQLKEKRSAALASLKSCK
jgi:hypothetical protein